MDFRSPNSNGEGRERGGRKGREGRGRERRGREEAGRSEREGEGRGRHLDLLPRKISQLRHWTCVNRFSEFFVEVCCNKFATRECIIILPYAVSVTALPCKILITKLWCKILISDSIRASKYETTAQLQQMFEMPFC